MRKIALYTLDFNLTPFGHWSVGQRRAYPRIVCQIASAYGLKASTAGAVAVLAGLPVEGR